MIKPSWGLGQNQTNSKHHHLYDESQRATEYSGPPHKRNKEELLSIFSSKTCSNTTLGREGSLPWNYTSRPGQTSAKRCDPFEVQQETTPLNIHVGLGRVEFRNSTKEYNSSLKDFENNLLPSGNKLLSRADENFRPLNAENKNHPFINRSFQSCQFSDISQLSTTCNRQLHGDVFKTLDCFDGTDDSVDSFFDVRNLKDEVNPRSFIPPNVLNGNGRVSCCVEKGRPGDTKTEVTGCGSATVNEIPVPFDICQSSGSTSRFRGIFEKQVRVSEIPAQPECVSKTRY